MKHKSLNQLLCAAVINGRFRETLLRDPAQALASGYYEHSFSLTAEERDLVMGIRAQKLEDFAEQVHRWISGNAGRSDSVPTYERPYEQEWAPAAAPAFGV